MKNWFKKRKSRRHAVASIISTLEQILALERNYCLSISDSSADEDRQAESEYAVDTLYEVIDSLREIY